MDVHVGGRIRLRRTLLGMNQEQLGLALGCSFQQIQKYERGTNRVVASRLHDIANVLDVPVSFFFDDAPAETAVKARTESENLMSRREARQIVRAYYAIPNHQIRKNLFELIAEVGDDAECVSP
jgi:transcriptional regulator with XRE-family HTH domain